MRILIAEDDATSRLVLQGILLREGYQIIVAEDGKTALEILEGKRAPRLAILDWMMPEMDGVEVVRHIREMRKADPPYIILLTALGRKEDIVTGLDAGADDYIVKPFDRAELLARVRVGQRIVQLQDALAKRVAELEEAQEHIRTLQGIIPVCMYCHKVRTDDESWQRLEQYVAEHTDARFSHGICPDCLAKHRAELLGDLDDEGES